MNTKILGGGMDTTTYRFYNDERGFSSLVIAAVLVLVLSLLTVGFAELMRSNERQSLDQQLSDQAYYAAESGVNDAMQAISNGFTQDKTSCGPVVAGSPGSAYLSNQFIGQGSHNDGNSPQWTCLLINHTPTTLEYSHIDTVTPTTAVFEPVDPTGLPANLKTLTVYWQGTDPSMNTFRSSSNTVFPPNSSWNSQVGILRFSITPLGSLDRQTLINNTFTAYLYPNKQPSGSVTYSGSPNQQGVTLNGGCNVSNSPRFCYATINGLPSAGPLATNNKYLITLRSIYSPTSVTVQGTGVYQNGRPGPVNFDGPQIMVDSTGKSLNVLKRLQVRVPVQNSYNVAGFDAESTGSICKQLSAYPGNVTMGC